MLAQGGLVLVRWQPRFRLLPAPGVEELGCGVFPGSGVDELGCGVFPGSGVGGPWGSTIA